MHRDITRRDFLNGINVAVTGSLLSMPLAKTLAATDGDPSAQMLAGYYPPTRDGLRGSHPGSFEVAHRMRDGDGTNTSVFALNCAKQRLELEITLDDDKRVSNWRAYPPRSPESQFCAR